MLLTHQAVLDAIIHVKTAADDEDEKKPKKPKRFAGGAAYPSYDKAITTQLRRNPQAAGAQRAVSTGGLGAVLGALATRLITKNPALVAAGGVAGGAVGGVAGYRSGRDEAKSDYSRLLYLRRRLKVNEPGELDALIRHPEIGASGIKSGMDKSGGPLAKILGGAAVGGGLGYFATPHLGGYADVEPARRASGVIDAALGGIVGGLSHRAGGFRKLVKNLPTKALVGIPTAAGAGEMVPIGMSTLHRTNEAMKDMSGAGRSLADSSKVTSIPHNLKKLLGSSAGRGAGVGAAGAGMAAILTGLNRRKSDDEIMKHKSRGGMIGSDFLKYVIPAMLAGGVAGSMRKSKPEIPA